MWNKIKAALPLGLIVALAILTRFLYLDRIPNSVNGDELIYILTAKSVYLTGHDISGIWNPLSVFAFRYPPNQQQAELPYFLHLFFSGPLPFSLFIAKLPFAILSVGIVVLLYLISGKLLGKSIGLITGLVASMNPWLVVMGRTAFESTPATFFYLLALYMLLNFTGWNILYGIIPFTLAFYSYIATKLIFVPFIILAVTLAYYFHGRRYGKQYIILCLLSLIIVIGYIVLLKTSSTESRISELLLPTSPVIATQVNKIRQYSIQSRVLSLLINKYSVYFKIIIEKFLRIFSSSYLFVEGDQFFLPVRQGFFYYIDVLFLITGFISLFFKRQRYFVLLGLFIVLGTLPHLFHKTMGDFSGHLALMFPFMIIVIGFGVSEIIRITSKHLKLATIIIISSLYIFSLGNFGFTYLYQYPLVGSGDFPMRVLSRYLTIATQLNVPVTIYSTTGRDFLNKYLFYTNSLTKQTIPVIANLPNSSSFSFGNIHFSSCEGFKMSENPSAIEIVDSNCDTHTKESYAQIQRLSDSGNLYKIFNDHICSPYSLNAYPTDITIQDFQIENLSRQKFCQTYIGT